MDVVGSTKMKVDERPTAIAATFQAYEELVKKNFAAYGVWKQTWTPDGVMACFLDTTLAVSAAQAILGGLAAFNADHNQLRSPFHVRAGLNVGEVSIFEDSALEKVADHAIDVAGHMQKYAGEDALWLSEEVLGTLASRDGFVATGTEVDGLPAFAWRPHVA
jgi:class 3 adenylate cyclase